MTGGRGIGGPTLLGELEDDEDGALAEEDDDNEENEQEVTSPIHCSIFVRSKRIFSIFNSQEDDEENEEEGDGGEGEYEEVMVSRNLLAAFMEEEAQPQPSKRRAWDDEFVLKRQFSALIPAFDPRPGRTNINQVL